MAVWAHKPVALSRWSTTAYLRLAGRAARRFDDGLFKNRLMNVLRDVSWPDVPLPAKQVRLARGVAVSLVPHIGEFDFEALFQSSLCYEREVFAALTPLMHQYDTVIEIGANVGIFTLFFAKTIEPRSGHVFAFEPSQIAFRRLCENLALNNVSNVSAFNCAIGARTQLVSFFEPSGHLSNGSLSREFAEQFSSDVCRREVLALDGTAIDKLVPPNGRTLIKIDVEGSEAEVLRTLESFILERRPDIVLEVLPGYDHTLNDLAFIDTEYRRYLITGQGTVEKGELTADPRFRDYLMVAIDRSQLPTTDCRRSNGGTSNVSPHSGFIQDA